MSFRSSGLRFYAFPPFSMILRFLEKVVQDVAELALLSAFLAEETVVPYLLSPLAGTPWALSCQPDLITQPLS